MTIQGEHAAVSKVFEDKTVRRRFIRNVFILVAAQLALVTASAWMANFNDGLRDHLTADKNSKLVIGALIGSIVAYIMTGVMIYCSPWIPRRFPRDCIFLTIAVASSIVIVPIVAVVFEFTFVIVTLGVGLSCCVGIILFSFSTTYDVHSWHGGMNCFLWGLLSAASLTPMPYFSNFTKILGVLLAHILMLVLMLDTRRIMWHAPENALSPEEYVFVALEVHSDIIMSLLVLPVVFVLGWSYCDPCAESVCNHFFFADGKSLGRDVENREPEVGDYVRQEFNVTADK